MGHANACTYLADIRGCTRGREMDVHASTFVTCDTVVQEHLHREPNI
jgi:hypothetical protein